MGAGGQPFSLAPMEPLVEDQLFYVGVRDAVDPSVHEPSLAYEIRNMIIRDPFVGQGISGRPGFVRAGAQVASAEVQCIHQLSKLDGTELTIAVVGGELYSYDWNGDSWSQVIDSTDLSGASITLASTGRVFAVTFADLVIFSDGTNKPFSWDGVNAAGLTNLSNASVWYGQPVVYYAKLFGIKATERTTITWSEENDPTTGYEAGGYNNAWELGQTDQEALYTLTPTNEALFYSRSRSVGAIRGQVRDNFQTTGTHEAISPKVGSISPAGWAVVGDKLYFVDSDGRTQAILFGQGLIKPEVWRPAAIGQATVNRDALEKACMIFNEDHDSLIGAVAMGSGTTLTKSFNFNPLSGRYVGYYDGFEGELIVMAKDGDGRPTMMHGDADGYVFRHAHLNEAVWSDRTQANAKVAIAHALEGGVFGHSNREEKILDRVDVTFVGHDLTMVVLKVTTERGTQDSGLTWNGVSSSSSLWDTMVWDTNVWDGGDVTQVRKSFGLDWYGRWFRVRWEHENIDEQFGVMSVTAEMYPEGPDVRMP